MAGSGVSAGHETRVGYKWENNGFAEGPGGSQTSKTFGANAQVNTAEGSNAIQRVFRPGKRTAVDQLAMVFDGSWAVQFTLTNPWWLRTLLGNPSTSGSGPTYTHEYVDNGPTSFQIIQGHEQSGKERILKGCIATRATIDTSVEQAAQVTLEGAYADENLKSPDSLTSQPTTSYDPLTFAEGSIAIDGTTESYVQSMSATIEANADPIREMGSRLVVDFNPKVLAPSVNFGKLFDGDHQSLVSVFGGSPRSDSGSSVTNPQENADNNKVKVKMSFDNGKSGGSGQNKGTVTLHGTLADSYGESGQGDPRADLEETVNRSAQDVDVNWTNEVESAP